MKIESQKAEEAAVLAAAEAMCAAARTAPKACGIDTLDSAILTGEDKAALSAEMRRIAELDGDTFFIRDADNVDQSLAVVLIGADDRPRGVDRVCSLCGWDGCGDCVKHGGKCIMNSVDLGIAVGSAVSLAADLRMDNRVMFTAGKAAASLGLLGEKKLIFGIPLSVSGKSPFFDRKFNR
ncbi:MAG: ferredoxin [Oscillospiraceae bacterium]|nr:ferredoxin [Oscillospiraceae bacterium]MBR4692407.1 ferredoxin [Oscillospiraceae bacterium]